MAGMKRIAWHTFGLAVSMVFVVGLLRCGDSLADRNSFSALPAIGWAIVSLAGFAGAVRYMRWYRSGS
jgi:hypothetical protein